jgi:hypothetical protein
MIALMATISFAQHERGGRYWPYLVPSDLLLDVVLQQVTEALLVTGCNATKLLLEDLLVE